MRKSAQPRMRTTSFTAASRYGKEFVELVWENGEIQVRGPWCRWRSDSVKAKGEKRGKSGSIVNLERAREDCDHDMKYTTPTVDHHYHHHHHHEFYSSENMATAAAVVPQNENENECDPEYEYAHLKAAVEINARKLATTITQSGRLRASPRGINCSDRIYSSSVPEVVQLHRQPAACVSDHDKTPTTPHSNKRRRSTHNFSHFSRLIRLASTFPKPKPNTTATSPCTCTHSSAAATNYNSFITDTDQRLHLQPLIIERVTNSTPTTSTLKHFQINPTKPPHQHRLSLPVPADEHSEAFGINFTPPRPTPPPPPVPSSSACSLGASNSPPQPHPLNRTSDQETQQSAYDPCKSVEQEPKAVTKPAIARPRGTPKTNRTAQFHNFSQKRRRNTINKKMRALQELLPNCNKVDKVSMLDDAIEYLKALQLQLQMLWMGNGIMAPQMMLPAGAPHSCDPLMMRLLPTSNYRSGFQMLPFPPQLLPFNTIPLHSFVPPAISSPTTLFDQHYFASKPLFHPYVLQQQKQQHSYRS